MSRRGGVWEAPERVRALFPPGVSGNDVNGRGESRPRRPTPIFWHRPEKEVFGALQTAVVERFNSVPAFHDVYAKGDRGPRRLEPVHPERRQGTPEGFSAEVKAHALANEADLVGIARLDPGWIYEGYEHSLPYVVVFGVAMDHARLSEVPSSAENPTGQVEVALAYNRGARVAMRVAGFIRSLGYEAVAHSGPWAGALNMLPAALACGFGELGKHGSIINRTYGSSFRLAAVSTDLPLVADAPDAFGADDFCTRCQVCRNACPPDAIGDVKQLVRGVEKWYVDFDKCIPYFDETYGCGICIAVCPWSTPGRAPKLAERWAQRRRPG